MYTYIYIYIDLQGGTFYWLLYTLSRALFGKERQYQTKIKTKSTNITKNILFQRKRNPFLFHGYFSIRNQYFHYIFRNET